MGPPIMSLDTARLVTLCPVVDDRPPTMIRPTGTRARWGGSSQPPLGTNSRGSSRCGLSQSLTVRSRSEFPITLTELSAMAAPANIGDSSQPNAG